MQMQYRLSYSYFKGWVSNAACLFIQILGRTG